jgi:UDP-N-acetylglucosamine diphosphorylase/glucosamine-1-phosphate N-acetyltransferase
MKNIINVIICEDGTHERFYPFSETRPLWSLRAGAYTIHERIELVMKKRFGRFTILCKPRPPMTVVASEFSRLPILSLPVEKGDLVLVNALLMAHDFSLEKGEVAYIGNRIAAAFLDASYVETHSEKINHPDFNISSLADDTTLKKVDKTGEWILPDFIWDLVLKNGEMIRRDFEIIERTPLFGNLVQVSFLGDPSLLHIEPGVKIDPFVCVDTRRGPVIIRSGCEIASFTRIEGPCSIGESCILLGGKVREGCSFGPDCRIGGEVEDSIFQGYSNKYHDGFIGHAYIGQWVNLGALTTNSDLRNDYKNVSCKMPEGTVDTGSPKVGCVIGDYSKTSIGSLINTGSIIGTASMIVHSGRMTPPHIPSFSRFIKNELRAGDFAGIVKTNRAASERRGKEFSPVMENHLREVFEATVIEREAEYKKWNSAL